MILRWHQRLPAQGIYGKSTISAALEYLSPTHAPHFWRYPAPTSSPELRRLECPVTELGRLRRIRTTCVLCGLRTMDGLEREVRLWVQSYTSKLETPSVGYGCLARWLHLATTASKQYSKSGVCRCNTTILKLRESTLDKQSRTMLIEFG